jgi:hypothetical protein
VRIAVSSSTFRRPLAAAELTQLEWLERCASQLGADGVLADIVDFPRRDAEYVAQLRKVAIDLGLVPFGLDAAGLLDPGAALDEILGIAAGFGAAIIRTALPAPGDVPPAAFAAAVAAGKALGRAAKDANVTVVVGAAPGTLGADLGSIKRLLKDVDSAWLRACPPALVDPAEVAPKDRFPAVAATPGDDPQAVVERAARGWVILDAPTAEAPWGALAQAVGRLREAEARHWLATST